MSCLALPQPALPCAAWHCIPLQQNDWKVMNSAAREFLLYCHSRAFMTHH